MAENRGLAYIEPGVVEIQDIDFPKLALGTSASVTTGSFSRSSPPTSAAAISTWCAGAPPRPPA